MMRCSQACGRRDYEAKAHGSKHGSLTPVFVAVVKPAKNKPSCYSSRGHFQNHRVTQNYGPENKGKTTVLNDLRVFLNFVVFPIRSKNSAF